MYREGTCHQGHQGVVEMEGGAVHVTEHRGSR